MAEDATADAGQQNAADQAAADQGQQAGADQQTQGDQDTGYYIPVMGERVDADTVYKEYLKSQSELAKRNAPQETQTPEPSTQSDGDEFVGFDADGSPITRKQIETSKKLLGLEKYEEKLGKLDNLDSVLDEALSRREANRQVEDKFESLAKTYNGKGDYQDIPQYDPVKNRPELVDYMTKNYIGDPEVAWKAMNEAAFIEHYAKQAQNKTSVGDQSDAPRISAPDKAKMNEELRAAQGDTNTIAKILAKYDSSAKTE